MVSSRQTRTITSTGVLVNIPMEIIPDDEYNALTEVSTSHIPSPLHYLSCSGCRVRFFPYSLLLYVPLPVFLSLYVSVLCMLIWFQIVLIGTHLHTTKQIQAMEMGGRQEVQRVTVHPVPVPDVISTIHPSTVATSVTSNHRTYLEVPFEERTTARRMGAVWDKTQSQWYVPAGTDLTLFHVFLKKFKKG